MEKQRFSCQSELTELDRDVCLHLGDKLEALLCVLCISDVKDRRNCTNTGGRADCTQTGEESPSNSRLKRYIHTFGENKDAELFASITYKGGNLPC